jgi:hypothetical protein
MGLILTSKAPGERIAYLWTPNLSAGDSISGTPTATRVSGTATVDSVSVVSGQVKIVLISGADGEISQFLFSVNTTGADIIQETLYLPVHTTELSALGLKLVQKFPAFASVVPSTIDLWLDDAAIVANWGDEGAQMLLACHYMAINGLGTNPVATGLTKLKSGTVDMTFSEAQANAIGFAQTIYGQQFYILLRRRHAGPRVVRL